MKKLVMLLIVVFGALLVGCEGMVDNRQQRETRYHQISDLNMRGFVDDWDEFWLYDRNSRLTQWHPRAGF